MNATDDAVSRPRGEEIDNHGYSRAFDNIVSEPEDTVGLLAYALYKQAIKEEAADGRRDHGSSRNPPRTVVAVYRDSAERILQEFASNAIEEATPEVQRSAALNAIEALETDLTEHVTRRTGTVSAILANLLAWFITIVITIAMLILFALPSIQENLIDAVRSAASAPLEQWTSGDGNAGAEIANTPGP